MTIWNALMASNNGSRISPEIPLIFNSAVNDTRISWVEEGSDAQSLTLVETNLSIDGGVTYLGWKAANNEANIPDVTNLVTDLSNAKIQIRITFSVTDGIALPSIRDLQFSIDASYPENGYWLSPVYDFTEEVPTLGTVDWTDVDVPEGTSNQMQWRISHDGENWLEWSDFNKEDLTLPTVGMYMQMRMLLTPDENRQQTPKANNFKVNITDGLFRGVWESDAIDMSQAKDKDSAKVVVDYVNGGGALLIQSRGSEDNATWGEWSNAVADGSLTHEGKKYVQIRLVYGGATSEVKEATISFDGVPQATLLQTGMTAGAAYSFTTLRDKLIVANGKDAVAQWDGNTETLSPLSGDPVVLRSLVTHQNRVWGVDAENLSRIRYSDILDPESWDAFSFFDFNPEDGDFITSMVRYGQNLVVSKQRSMALLTGNKSTNYSISWLDSEQGVAGLRAMTQADKYLAYVSQDGVRFTDLNNSILATERILPTWENINHRRLSQAAVTYWRNSLLVALPEGKSLINNVVWAFDFLRSSWSIYKGWSVSAWLKFHQYGEDVLLAADSTTGQVYQMFKDYYDDTIPVSYKWRSKDFHFGHPERFKLFRNIYLDIEGTAETTMLEIDVFVDGEITGTYSTEIPAGNRVKHVRRILPPLYGAVLGRSISLQVRGRCGIQSISIEYVVRGAVAGGEL